MEDYQKAVSDYTQAISLKPDYDRAYFNRGMVYKKLGKKDGAIADFKKVLEISKDEELRKASEIALKALGER